MAKNISKEKRLSDSKSKEKLTRTEKRVNDEKLFHEIANLLKNNPSVLNHIEKEKPVTESEWSQTHPKAVKCGSDKYYTSIANEILNQFELLPVPKDFPKGVMRTSALSIAAYLEDLVSDTGVWDAMRQMYQKKSGKILPFYTVDPNDYFDDDINIEDIRLLIWQAFARIGDAIGVIYSPISQAVDIMAKMAFDILVERFDSAPRAQRVYDLMRSTMRSGDYFSVRSLALWLVIDNPLTAVPYMRNEIQKEAYKTLDYLKDNRMQNLTSENVFYLLEARKAWTKYMSMNGCGSNELLAVIAAQMGFNDLAEKLSDLKEHKDITFTIEDSKSNRVTLKDELGREYKTRKDSFGITDWNRMKMVSCSLVRFGDEYMQNGVAIFAEEVPKKKDLVKLSTSDDKLIREIRQLIDKHDGQRLFYCKDIKEVSEIIDEIMPFKGQNQADANDILLILSSIDGIMMNIDDCSIIDDPKNPFFKKKLKNLGDKQMEFITNSQLPDDVIDYIVERKLLPQAKIFTSQGDDTGIKLVQDNMDFLFHFYRVDPCDIPEYKEDDKNK